MAYDSGATASATKLNFTPSVAAIVSGADFRAALVISAAGFAALERAFALPGHTPLDFLPGFGLAVLVWGWIWALDQFVDRLASRPIKVALRMVLGFAFYVCLCADFAYTYFYSVAENRELSLISIGLFAGLRTLFGQLLPPRGIAVLAGLFVAVHVAAALLARLHGLRLRAHEHGALLGLCALSLGMLITAAKRETRIPSPFADLGRELYFLATTPKLDLDRAPRLPFDPRILDKSAADDPAQSYAFDNVLVFVMETTIVRDFESERKQLPADTFVNRVAGQVHRYTNYHGNNQDSRTGMLDMLQSRVIPYEAYADGVDHYAFVARLPSLVDRFNARGYETAYAVSHADREDVLADLAWRRVILLPNEEVDALRSAGKALCVTIYEFEYGCEDRAILPKLFALLDQHPKVFLFQEFIWGHDPEYNEISGRSNADYYSSYLDAVIEHLRATGKLEHTLIVLTSDHGYRGHATLGESYAYHLPLWFYAPGFDARADDRLFSHIDFRELLLHELGAAGAPSTPDPFVPVIGPTGITSLTILDPDGELALIRTRGRSHFVLAQHPAPGRNRLALNPASYAGFLDEYRARFDAQRASTSDNHGTSLGRVPPD